jgi:branched-chain amino acid transport system ATP-binding protein
MTSDHIDPSTSADLKGPSSDVPALSLVNVTAGYGSHPVIFDVSLTFPMGRVTTVIGPNGAGKSTVLSAIFGQARLFEGQISFDGEELKQSGAELVRRGIAYVPQRQRVFRGLSVGENLELGSYARSGFSVEEVLDVFPELRGKTKVQAGKLSGGQEGMLAIARALRAGPKLLLLDEATSGFAPLIAQALWDCVASLVHRGIGVVAVEQNVDLALAKADDAVIFSSGRPTFSGPAAMVTEELLTSSFLGSSSDDRTDRVPGSV